MKDIHSHILMGIDDGSKDLKTSLEILKKAEQAGITDIMLTPHYINQSNYVANNQEKIELLQLLKKEAEATNIHINLYLGNEVYIDNELLTLIKEGKVLTLNDSRYILIELPLTNKLHHSKEILFEIIRNGYVPILAHPERYLYMQKKPLQLREYLEMGVLLQGNYQSLFGGYGKEAKRALKILLKKGMIHFLGSDIHRVTDDYQLKKLKKKLLRITKNEKVVEDLLDRNFEKVINNEKVSI